MFRIQGYVLPENQIIRTALTKIYGIGLPTSKKILQKFDIRYNTRVRDVSEEQQKLISDELKEYTLENDLRREISADIKRLREIKCYRGIRHSQGLPVRGQTTLRNAKTAKKLLGRSRVRPVLKK